MYKIYVVCPPGLEQMTLYELTRLGFVTDQSDSHNGSTIHCTVEPGGVELDGTLLDVYRANLNLRTASRILVRLSTFYATTFEKLFINTSRLPWEQFLNPNRSITLRVTCHKSRLYHSDGVAKEVVHAIESRMGKSFRVVKYNENEDEAGIKVPQLVMIRLLKNRCTISVDSSGENLHRRGYRLETAKAPLRETLAAGILMASGWDRRSPLLDPFCGSGTIAIEAALMALERAPGRNRTFSFMDWQRFDLNEWENCIIEANKPVQILPPQIFASDRDAGAIKITMMNAERAGVADYIHVSCHAVSAIAPPPTIGWLVTNPPYGVRVSPGNDLRNLYAQMGNVLRAKCDGWRVGILCNDDLLINQTRLKFDSGFWLTNGGIKVKFSCGFIKV